jgi:hypothetical protein
MPDDPMAPKRHHHHVEDRFGPGHASVEEGQSGDGHQQDEGGADDEERRRGIVDRGRLGHGQGCDAHGEDSARLALRPVSGRVTPVLRSGARGCLCVSSRAPSHCVGHGRSVEDCGDEGLRVEGCQVVRALSEADQLDRHAELALDGDDDAALGGAVELGEHDAGDVDDLGRRPRPDAGRSVRWSRRGRGAPRRPGTASR